MEMSQGNSLCSYLKQTKKFYTIRKQEGRIGPAWKGWYQWVKGEGEKMVWEGKYSANIVYIYVFKWKNDIC
jgi:hypothetical protein